MGQPLALRLAISMTKHCLATTTFTHLVLPQQEMLPKSQMSFDGVGDGHWIC
jgi:hypothetical protein